MLFLDTAIRFLFAHSALPEFLLFGANAERWNIPARVISLVRGGDYIILPRDPRVEMFWRFWRDLTGLNDYQVLWTEDAHFLLTEDVVGNDAVRQEVERLLGPGGPTVSSYAHWQQIRGNGHPVSYHPGVLSEPGPFIYLKSGMSELVRQAGLDSSERAIMPRTSPVCRDVPALIAAYDALRRLGVERIIVKPDLGSAGDGIEEVTREALATYAFSAGSVVLQERLQIDRDQEGTLTLVSVHWERSTATGGQVVMIGGVKDQLMHGNGWAGTRSPSRTAGSFQAETLRLARMLVQRSALANVSTGGFDFASVNSRPVLLDVNPRFTGTHLSEVFVARHAFGRPYTMWSIESELDVNSIWDRLNRRDVAFQPTVGSRQERSGIFPIVWLPGVTTKLLAIGSTPAEVEHLQTTASELL